MVHHSVEGLVEIGELIVSLLMDAHVEIIAFHTSEGVHQRPDGFVHQMTHRECKQAHGEHGNHPEQHQEKEIGMAEAKQMFRGRKGDQNQIALLQGDHGFLKVLSLYGYFFCGGQLLRNGQKFRVQKGRIVRFLQHKAAVRAGQNQARFLGVIHPLQQPLNLSVGERQPHDQRRSAPFPGCERILNAHLQLAGFRRCQPRAGRAR